MDYTTIIEKHSLSLSLSIYIYSIYTLLDISKGFYSN